MTAREFIEKLLESGMTVRKSFEYDMAFVLPGYMISQPSHGAQIPEYGSVVQVARKNGVCRIYTEPAKPGRFATFNEFKTMFVGAGIVETDQVVVCHRSMDNTLLEFKNLDKASVVDSRKSFNVYVTP